MSKSSVLIRMKLEYSNYDCFFEILIQIIHRNRKQRHIIEWDSRIYFKCAWYEFLMKFSLQNLISNHIFVFL